MRRTSLDDVAAPAPVRAALRRFLDEVRRSAPGKVERVLVFGSVARGEAGPESDVDLLVVWRGTLGEGLRVLTPITTDILIDMGVDLSAMPIPVESFDAFRRMRTQFYENIEREAFVVA